MTGASFTRRLLLLITYSHQNDLLLGVLNTDTVLINHVISLYIITLVRVVCVNHRTGRECGHKTSGLWQHECALARTSVVTPRVLVTPLFPTDGWLHHEHDGDYVCEAMSAVSSNSVWSKMLYMCHEGFGLNVIVQSINLNLVIIITPESIHSWSVHSWSVYSWCTLLI